MCPHFRPIRRQHLRSILRKTLSQDLFQVPRRCLLRSIAPVSPGSSRTRPSLQFRIGRSVRVWRRKLRERKMRNGYHPLAHLRASLRVHHPQTRVLRRRYLNGRNIVAINQRLRRITSRPRHFATQSSISSTLSTLLFTPRDLITRRKNIISFRHP
jgi:hypothetical protein